MVQRLYGEDYYGHSPLDDPKGLRVRACHASGGGLPPGRYRQSRYRNYNTPQSRYLNLGLRVVMEEAPATTPSR